MVGGRRRNPRAHQGADVKIGPAASNSFSRMPGSWLGIKRPHRIRGWQGATLSHKSEFAETNNWRLTPGPSYEGFGCRPFPNACRRATLGPASESLQRRKPRVGRAPIRRRELWGFESRQRLLTSGRNDHRRRFGRIEGAQAVLSAGVGMMFFAAAVLGRVGRRTMGRAPAARSNDPR
jgi:hypothetical protein